MNDEHQHGNSRLDVHIHLPAGVLDLLTKAVSGIAKVNETLKQVLKEQTKMSAELDALTAQVKINTDVEESAIVLINGLAAQILALKTDPVALTALAASLKTEADSLGAAVAANTTPVTP
jgi:hypothetical protein